MDPINRTGDHCSPIAEKKGGGEGGGEGGYQDPPLPPYSLVKNEKKNK